MNSKKSETELRTVTLKVRFNQTEIERVAALAARCGRPVSVYCREIALSTKTVVPVKDSERWGTLGRLGKEFVEVRRQAQNGCCSPEELKIMNDLIAEIQILRRELL